LDKKNKCLLERESNIKNRQDYFKEYSKLLSHNQSHNDNHPSEGPSTQKRVASEALNEGPSKK
jgi:hypothetical protein